MSKPIPACPSIACGFYDLDEKNKIDAEARGLLFFLEQSDILTPQMRELAIDRAMAMEEYIDIGQMKWILMITLFYHPSQKIALDWIQDLVLHGDVMH